MHIYKTEKGDICELSMGDRLIFRHGSNAKIYTVQPNEKLYLLGKQVLRPYGGVYEIEFSDPLMDLQFDEMGIMADVGIVINTNIISTILVFGSLEHAEAFLKGSTKEELVRETIFLQSKIARVPVVQVDKGL